MESDDGKNVRNLVNAWNADVASALDNVLPKVNIMRAEYKKPKLAKTTLDLYYVLKTIDDAVRSEELALRPRQLTFWKGVFVDNICAWVETAIYLANQTRVKSAKSLLIVLSPTQLRRPYLGNGGFLPEDEVDQKCLFCKHTFVDMPKSSASVLQQNQTLMEEHAQAMKEYEQKKKEGQSVPKAKPKLKLLVREKHCHCHQFTCCGAPTPSKTQCPIKCINPDTKTRYKVVGGVCECPLCLCRCKKAK